MLTFADRPPVHFIMDVLALYLTLNEQRIELPDRYSRMTRDEISYELFVCHHRSVNVLHKVIVYDGSMQGLVLLELNLVSDTNCLRIEAMTYIR